jgi:uncharacterized protein
VTRFTDVALRCPNCRHTFTVSQMSSTTVHAWTTEFRPSDAVRYVADGTVHTCAACGLSGPEERFSGTVPQAAARLIAERLTPLVRQGPLSPARQHEFAAWVADWRGEGDETVARHFLSAAWCCRAKESADAYRRRAIQRFERALAAGEVDGASVPSVTYLVGELYRRVGEVEAAHAWFDRAVMLASADPRHERIAWLAARQRTDPADLV